MRQLLPDETKPFRLYTGDCRDVLAAMPEASMDTVICDPPYGLRFMGKGWDHGVPGEEFWEALMRVAKPGAMLLAFGGTRTFHRLACAIEDAGWEMRDCLMWLYGTGFPKSHNISKAIDKKLGATRPVVGTGRAGAGSLERKRRVELGYRKNLTDVNPNNYPITASATDEAVQWDGYGTAFKPGWEPIILAMKPVDGTFANNALEHGVAGRNIDGARVPLDGEMPPTGSGNGSANSKFSQVQNSGGNGGNTTPENGRWPANVVLDEEAAAMLDEQSGVLKSGARKRGQKRHSEKTQGIYGSGWAGDGTDAYPTDVPASAGGASRFFYCAKASKKERGDYNNHPTVKPVALMRWLCRLTATPTGGIVLDPFMGSGSTGIAALAEGRMFVGVDLEPDYARIAKRRIEESVNATG